MQLQAKVAYSRVGDLLFRMAPLLVNSCSILEESTRLEVMFEPNLKRSPGIEGKFR